MNQELLKEPPLAGSEVDTLLGSLERGRRLIACLCNRSMGGGLDAAAMATTVGASTITLGGLVRHLARVEEISFAWKLHGREVVWTEADRNRDWAWTADDDVAQVWRQWHAAVARSRELVAEALADGGLDRATGHEFAGWGTPSLRRIVADMIEEYARHPGHADLIRGAVDGLVGEDAPEE